MHPNSESITPVRRLQRPPICRSVLVHSDSSHTFDSFVHTIALWWPVSLFSSGKAVVQDILVEERLGGRISEIWEDGTIVVWEALSEAQWGQTCPRPGGYAAGWERILGAFVAAIGKQPTGTRLLPGNQEPQRSIPAGFCRTKRDPRLDPSTRCCQHPSSSSADERSDGGRTEPLC